MSIEQLPALVYVNRLHGTQRIWGVFGLDIWLGLEGASKLIPQPLNKNSSSYQGRNWSNGGGLILVIGLPCLYVNNLCVLLKNRLLRP